MVERIGPGEWMPPDTGVTQQRPPRGAHRLQQMPYGVRPPAVAPPRAVPAPPAHAWPAPGHPWPVDQTGQYRRPWAPARADPNWQPRPTYREPHPIRTGSVWAGIGATALLFLIIPAVTWNLVGYLWATIATALVVLVTAVALARYGDRGVAVGVGATAGVALAIPGIIVLVNWFSGHWLLW